MLARALRWMAAQTAFLAVLLVLAVAFATLIVDSNKWRAASGIVAAAVLLGGVLRAVLPSTRAGLLAVRSRWLDTVLYLALGGLILALDLRLHS